MKKTLSEEIKEIFAQGKDWVKMEVEYAKLTAAEKISVLVSTLILVITMLVIGFVVLIVFALALIDLFELFMPHALACVTVGGIFILILLLLVLLRKQIFVNPVARLISKLILTPKKKKS